MSENLNENESNISTRLPSVAKVKPKSLSLKEKRAQKLEEKKQRQEEKTKSLKEDNKWPAYEGKESLPKDFIKDKKGKIHKPGSLRYYLRQTTDGKYELIGVFRNGKGKAKKLIQIINPRHKIKGAQSKALLKELRACNVPTLDE